MEKILNQFLLVRSPLLSPRVLRQPFQIFFKIAKIIAGKSLEISGKIVERLIRRVGIKDFLG